jgi:hypothetical protein
VFALVVVLLPAQYWFARASPWGEPYPALLMPPFDGTRTDRHGLPSGESVAIIVSFGDGTVESVPLRTGMSIHMFGMQTGGCAGGLDPSR